MSRYLTASMLAGIIAGTLLIVLTVLVWPPGTWIAAILCTLGLLLVLSLVVHIRARKRFRTLWELQSLGDVDLTEQERFEVQLQAFAERERRLEIRELQLARHMRTQALVNEDYVDVLERDPVEAELAELVEADRRLIALIEEESQLAFNRVLKNRYAAEEGVNGELILEDIRDFVERVARLYRPDSADPLLETEIELVAKSLSSTALHLLVVVDGLPINLKSYNTAKMYRLIRRGASYYGTYKAVRPYLEQGLNLLQAARLALGMNPATVGAAWVTGKIASHGARALGEHVLQRRSLQLLHDFIRVIGFEAAMLYGGDFRHRDANWVLGAELVNLEISRGNDYRGRDAALELLCNLALRHEFDRVRLFSHLGRHSRIDVERVLPRIIMTREERDRVATTLLEHCRHTDVDPDSEDIVRWRESAQNTLDVDFGIAAQRPGPRKGGLRNRAGRFGNRAATLVGRIFSRSGRKRSND